MDTPTFIYHPIESPKIVDAKELPHYIKQGWSDTPETFNEVNDESETSTDDTIETDEKPRKGRKKGLLNNANDSKFTQPSAS